MIQKEHILVSRQVELKMLNLQKLCHIFYELD